MFRSPVAIIFRASNNNIRNPNKFVKMCNWTTQFLQRTTQFLQRNTQFLQRNTQFFLQRTIQFLQRTTQFLKDPLSFYKEPLSFLQKIFLGQKLSGWLTRFNKFVWIPNITVSYPEDDSDRRSKHVGERTVSDKHVLHTYIRWCCYVNRNLPFNARNGRW